jgi:LemA protein
MVTTWVFLIVLAGALLWAISAYNKLIALKGHTANAWKQIDVQLKRRHDLIPNLVEAVRGAMEFERETLEAVIQARNQAVKIQADAMPTGGVKALAGAEAALSSALSRLNVVVERYPDLKATANVAQLQEELTSTENRVSFARQLYNDTATTYNVRQQQFPWNLLAGIAKAETVELWEIVDEGEREVPKIDLSLKSK